MTHTSVYREKYNTLLDSGKSYAKSSPVRVSYFDPRTGEPCEEKPEPLTKAEKAKKSRAERDAERIKAEAEATEIMRNMEERKNAKRRKSQQDSAKRWKRPVFVDGVLFESVKAASMEVGTSPEWLGLMLRNGVSECKGKSIKFAESEV